MSDQISCADRVLEALADRNVADISLRDLIESMDDAGVVFAPGDQRDTIRRLDAMDAES